MISRLLPVGQECATDWWDVTRSALFTAAGEGRRMKVFLLEAVSTSVVSSFAGRRLQFQL